MCTLNIMNRNSRLVAAVMLIPSWAQPVLVNERLFVAVVVEIVLTGAAAVVDVAVRRGVVSAAVVVVIAVDGTVAAAAAIEVCDT
jgi:hypothetical protein